MTSCLDDHIFQAIACTPLHCYDMYVHLFQHTGRARCHGTDTIRITEYMQSTQTSHGVDAVVAKSPVGSREVVEWAQKQRRKTEWWLRPEHERQHQRLILVVSSLVRRRHARRPVDLAERRSRLPPRRRRHLYPHPHPHRLHQYHLVPLPRRRLGQRGSGTAITPW